MQQEFPRESRGEVERMSVRCHASLA